MRNLKRFLGIGEVLGSTCRRKSFSCGYNKEANTAVDYVLRTIWYLSALCTCTMHLGSTVVFPCMHACLKVIEISCTTVYVSHVCSNGFITLSPVSFVHPSNAICSFNYTLMECFPKFH